MRMTTESHFEKLLYILIFTVNEYALFLKKIKWFVLEFYLFIIYWLRWVFVAACRLSLVAASRGYSSLQCVGFSLRWLHFVAEHGL